jgi:hypothetical protein
MSSNNKIRGFKLRRISSNRNDRKAFDELTEKIIYQIHQK